MIYYAYFTKLGLEQGTENRRKLQNLSARVEKERHKRAMPGGSTGDFTVVPHPDIVVGHLDLHHSSFRVVDLIVSDIQALVKVHEH